MENSSIQHFINLRRSVRKYKRDAVELTVLEKLISCAIMAPSSSNSQPWEFVILTNDKLVEKVKLFTPGLMYPTPAIILCCLNKEIMAKKYEDQNSALCDLAMAAQNILLGALDFGLGTCVIRSFDPELIRQIVTLPEDVHPELIISVGYYEKLPKRPRRRSFSDVCHLNGWENNHG